MLEKLTINNYAIIDRLSIEPVSGLNIVTGETGAGKSIILGALSLILGERADTSVLINKEEKCVVEAVFDVKEYPAFATALKEEELDNEDECIIRREINTSGKSRAFINDTPVKLNVLNRLTSILVDLHRQFDHLVLDNDHFQLDVIDAIAGNNQLRKEYSGKYTAYSKLSREIDALKQRKAEWQKEADYKQFLLDELSELDLKEGELENAEKQLKQLDHAERIIKVIQQSVYSIEQGERPITGDIKHLLDELEDIAPLLPDVQPLVERIRSVYIELKDVAGELDDAGGNVTVDEEQMQMLQERMDAGYKLLKKHGLQTTAELLELQNKLNKELQESLDLDATINSKEKEQQALLTALKALAKELSAKRNTTAKTLTKDVNKLLALVGMPNAVFSVQVAPLSTPAATGMDEVQYYLDANKSGNTQPVYKAASGGEMSRIMLCIKSLTAKAMQLPTLIFDEVDTGVSGEAARQVGILLKELSTYHQVICITHQPQVAAKGDNHLFVHKEEKNGRIITQVKVLQPEERVNAIAKMIGGEQPGSAAMESARELVSS